MATTTSRKNQQSKDASQTDSLDGLSAEAASQLGGPPPSSIAAEQALLGSLLHNNTMFDRLPEELHQDHFYEPLHGRIFEQIKNRLQMGHGASPITLSPSFETDEAMGLMGGTQYLVRLAGEAVSWSYARDYANIVYATALRRMLIELGGDIQAMARDGGAEVTPQEQVHLAERKLFELGDKGMIDSGVRTFTEVAVEAVKKAEENAKRSRDISGLSTGLKDLDKMISGLNNSDLVIVAGRTSMGKSALAMNIAFNIAHSELLHHNESSGEQRQKMPVVAYFSLEMSAVQLTNRILSSRAGITAEEVTLGRIRQNQFSEFIQAADELAHLPLCIDDSPGLNIDSLCTRARRLARQRGLLAVFVDYLQLVEASIASRRDSREQRVAEVSRKFKGLAMELNVPVVALAQLSRQVEARDNKTPQLADLRESGSIEQDADIVCLIHREEVYQQRNEPKEDDEDYDKKLEEWQAKMDKVVNLATLFVSKHRNGPTGKLRLHFDKTFTRFRDLMYVSEDQEETEAFSG